MKSKKNLGFRGQGFVRNSFGIAYIYIPNDVDRDAFISKCYATNTVSIITENSEVINNVLIGKNTINFIEFPQKGKIGSLISFGNIQKNNQIIVLDVYNKRDEFEAKSENQIKITKKNLNNIGTFLIDVENNKVILSLNTDENSEITLRSISDNSNSSIKLISDFLIYLKGKNFNIEFDNLIFKILKNANIDIQENLGVVNKKSANIEIGEDLKIKFGGICEIGEGAEKNLKGETTQKQLETLNNLVNAIIDAFNTSPVVPTDGGAAFKAGLISTLAPIPKANFSEVLSDKTKIL